MKTVKRKGVRVDLCSDCGGMWFDGGELEQVIRKRSGKSYQGNLEFTGTQGSGGAGEVAFLSLDILLAVISHLFDPL